MFGIGEADRKQILGLAVTPNLGLEACVYNKTSGEVEKYCQKFLEYNIASKEIQDTNALRSTIADIFNELDLQKDKTNVYLVLPNVHFGFRSIEDSTIDSDAIESMILAETSESYIFKQEEPVSSWVDMNARTGASSKYIAHASIQKKVMEDLQDAAMDIGINLVGIESATSAIPRGIAMTGLCDDVISNNENWDILLINPNGYSIFQMSGSRMLEYVEIPFAIMSFEGEEVYSALSSAIAQYLPNYPAKKLVINSLTDNVSAKILKNEIVFDEDIVTIDSNRFGSSCIVHAAPDVVKQTAASLSLCALAASSPRFSTFATMNILGETSYDGIISYGSVDLNGKELDINSEFIVKTSFIISTVIVVLTLLLSGIFFGFGSYFGAQTKELNQKVEQLNTEIAAINSKLTASISALIRQISASNKTAINYYDSLSSDIPSHVWLTYYINQDGKNVGIEGFSLDINDIYEYFKSLKILAPQSDIKLNKLEVFRDEASKGADDTDSMVLNNPNKQQVYSFEISNTQYQKSFDANGNKTVPVDTSKDKKKAAAPAPASNDNDDNDIAPAAKIPNVPDVEINLKEIR